MRHFPIFLNLHGATALVIGQGDAADRRAASFAEAGASLRRAARFSPELLQDCAIAAGADAPDADLEALFIVAQARGIPVNIVDRPQWCSYITPSIIDRDPLTIAICSGGTAPLLARLLRSQRRATPPPPAPSRRRRSSADFPRFPSRPRHFRRPTAVHQWIRG